MNRSDLTSRIPEFITNAEAHFNRRLIQFKHPSMLNRDTSFAVSSRYTALPTGFVRFERAPIWKGNSLREKLEFITGEAALKYDDGSATTSRPLYYSIRGTDLELLPAPASATTLELSYWKRLTALTGTANWLLSAHPDAYLYRSLFEAALYMRDSARAAQYAQLYGDIEQAIKREAHHLRFGVAPAVMLA